jgi:hypothetical protein
VDVRDLGVYSSHTLPVIANNSVAIANLPFSLFFLAVPLIAVAQIMPAVIMIVGAAMGLRKEGRDVRAHS